MVFYATRYFHMAPPAVMPDEVVAILRKHPGTEKQLLPVLTLYAEHRFSEPRPPIDISAVRAIAEAHLRSEMQLLNTATALRSYIRRTHVEDTGTPLSDAELEATFRELKTGIDADDDVARKVRNMMFRDAMEQQFEVRHGMSIRQFLADMVATGR